MPLGLSQLQSFGDLDYLLSFFTSTNQVMYPTGCVCLACLFISL